MGLLSGKVAVITGSTRGLGLAIAQAYAHEGAAVVVSSRTQQAVARVVADLKVNGAQATGLACDVGDLEQVRALSAQAMDSFGRIDVWVNNAGIAGAYGPAIQLTPERFVRVVQTNILGTYYGSLVALEHMLPRGSGKLINLLGRGDREPVPFQNAYASSKAWVRNFTLALAKENKASRVGIYAFNPGLVDTDLLTDLEAVAGYEQKLEPLKTVIRLWANPPQIPARKAVWLASFATDGRTGLEVRVLGTPQLIGGLLKEGVRRLTRQTLPPAELKIKIVPPAQG